MPADVGESTDVAVIAANDDHAFAEILESAPLARLANFAFVADDLRRRAQERRLLRLQEFRIVVEPARQAQVRERVSARLNRFQSRRHIPRFATAGPLGAIKMRVLT